MKLFTIILILITSTSIWGVNNKIFSEGESSVQTLALFLSSGNKNLEPEMVNDFASIYIEEARLEGINWDVAFVQMCLETGYLKYGGVVASDQNNFCGLGAFGEKNGAVFSSVRDGVKAHIQHLKAYSSTEELKGVLLDPRFSFVERGSAENVEDLAGKWAEDPLYGNKLITMLQRINSIEKGEITSAVGAEAPSAEPAEESVSSDVSEDDLSADVSEDDLIEPAYPEDIEGEGWLR